MPVSIVYPGQRESMFHVNAQWDPEAQCWFAEAEDFPGLIAEAETVEGLLQELTELAPELAVLNKVPIEGNRIEFELRCKRIASIPVAA